MREILFRGKRIDNGKWVYGNYAYADIYTQHKHYIFQNKAFEYAVAPSSVGQYTGLKDKNGKRIFEGDIGKYKQTDGAKRNGQPISCTGKVIYNTKTASYAVESKDEAGCKYFDYFPIKDFEVIGNIHDNPELMEVR